MNDDDLTQLKQKLISSKAELQHQEELYKEIGETVELDQTRVGRVSRMDAMQAQQMALESARRRLGQIQKISGALQRMENDEYGTCFICGEEIDLKRLNVDPTNTRCLKCVE